MSLRRSLLLPDELDQVPGGGAVAADSADRRPQHMLVVVEELFAEVRHADWGKRHRGRHTADGLGVHHGRCRSVRRDWSLPVHRGELGVHQSGELLAVRE